MDIAELGLKADSSDLTRAEKAMGGVQRQAKKTETATERMEREFQRTSGTLQAFRGYAVAAAGALSALGLSFSAGQILREFASFEQGIRNVGAVARATDEQLDLLADSALRASAATRFNPSQTTQALYALASAGQAVNEQVETLPNVLNLAEAAQADLGRTTELITSTLNQFGLQADQSGRVADVFTASIGASALNVNRLQVAFRNAGPTAAAYGQTLEETTGVLGLLTTAFGNGERAGTGFRAALAELPKQAEELGVQVFNASGEMLPFVQILQNLEEEGITATQVVRDFGAEAGPALAALLSSGSDGLRDMIGQLDSSGQAARVAGQQLDTLQGDFNAFSSAVDVAMVSVGESQSELARGTVQTVTNLVRLWSGYGDTLGDARARTEQLATVIETIGFGVLAGGIGRVTAAFGAKTVAIGASVAAAQRENAVIAAGATLEAERTAAQARATAAQVADTRATMAAVEAARLDATATLQQTSAAKARSAALAELAVLGQQQARLNAQLAAQSTAAAAAQNRATAATAAAATALSSTGVGARAAATGVGLLRGAMGLLGGPLGVAVTGLTALYFWTQRNQSIADDMEPSIRTIRELADEAGRLQSGGAILSDEQASAVANAREEIERAARAVGILQDQMADARAAGQMDVAEELQREIDAIMAGIEDRSNAIRDLYAALEPPEFESVTETGATGASQMAEEVAMLTRQLDLMRGGMSAADAEIKAQRESLTGAELAAFNLRQQIDGLTESRSRMADLAQAAADLRAEMEAASRVRIDQLMQSNIGLFSDQTASQREFQERNAQLLELHARQHELVDSSEELQAAQEALREEFENREMVESFTELQDVMLAIEDDWSRAAAQILRGLENVSDETKRSTLGFAQMAQGAAGFFSEGTAGYEVMQKASEVFYAAEIAQAANAFALKQNWITTETALVTAQAGIKAAAEGVAAAASSMVGLPFPANLAALSATVAALAAIGVNISGGGGGGGGPAASLSASGTVLGDPSADSESIANSISALEDIASEELQYSSRMASSLANIEQALAGLGAQIARTPDLSRVNIARGSLSDLLGGGLVTGDNPITEAFGDWFDIPDAFGAGELSGIERQIQHAVGEMIDTAVTGFEALGRDGASAMEQALQATLPDLSIDANLPADELSERLSSFFSSISDSLVMVLDNGLVEDYQRLGEGLLETLTRIVSGMETAQAGLDRIGLSLGENLKPQTTIELTNALIEAAGGTSEFQNATENFVDSFLSESQQLDVATREATQALANIGMELPATRDGFRDLVQGFEVTDQASARVLSTLLSLAPAMDELYSASEEIQEEAMNLRIRLLEAQGEASAALELERQRELEGVAEVNREMLRQVYAAEDAARAEEELRRQREEAARQAAEIADQRQRLEIELLRTMGHEEEALRLERERQLASMPAQLHALQRQIWAEQELAAERERQAQIAQQSTELLRAFDVVPSAFQETLDQLGLMQSQLPRTAEAMGDFLMTLTEAERAALQPFVSDLQALTQQQTSTPRSYTPTTTVSDGISEAEDALRQAFNAEQSELNQTISQFEKLGSALGDFSDELSDLIATTVPGVSRVSSLRSEFDALMGRGLSGDTAALDALPGAGRSLVDEIERTATSRIDLIRQVSAVQREILAAEEAAGAQKSLAEQQLDEMRSQVSALIDINDSVLSVEEAIRDLTGGGYANGGIATGPESGYLTALHGDEAVIPLQGGGVPVYMRGGDKDNRMARIEQLLERMHETDEEGYRAIAKHVSKTAKNTERTADIQEIWDADGLPAERTS